MVTAGRAVVFSGATVAIGLVAMVFISVPFLRSVGYGGMIIPLVSVLVVLTLLPIMLSKAGRALDWPHRRAQTSAGRGWSGWARGAVVALDNRSWQSDGTALVTVIPTDGAGSAAGKTTVTRLRSAAPAGAQVGGTALQSMDFVDSVYGAFPYTLAFIALITYVLLARAFRSLILPLKAVLLNLLSLGAIVGTMVLVWQRGFGSEQIWNIMATGSIAEFMPIMIFAFLYGFSMDYEVFILTRMREEYDRLGRTDDAVVEGIGRTGRPVTSDALVLFLAVASLASAPDTEVKIFATGLGLGVLLDATVIRALMVPAPVSILGRANWWLPGWAARLLFLRTAQPPAGQSDIAEPVPVSGAS